MNSVKCPSCGIINFSGEPVCKKCGTDLRSAPAHVVTATPPVRSDTAPPRAESNRNLVIVAAAAALVVIVVVAAFWTRSAPPAAPSEAPRPAPTSASASAPTNAAPQATQAAEDADCPRDEVSQFLADTETLMTDFRSGVDQAQTGHRSDVPNIIGDLEKIRAQYMELKYPPCAAEAHAACAATMQGTINAFSKYVQEGEGRTSSDYYNETNSLWEESAYALQRLRSQRS